MTGVHPRIAAALRAQLRSRDPSATTATQLEPGETYHGPGPLHADAEVVIEVGPDARIAGLGVAVRVTGASPIGEAAR